MPSFTQEFSQLPESVQQLIRYVASRASPEQIILFGSRARGDHRPNSDFDLTVKGSIASNIWTEILVDLEEKALSLYPVDLVLFEELGDDYKQNIQAEGKVIYG